MSKKSKPVATDADLPDRVMAAIARNTSRRPARAADVLSTVGATEEAFWAALDVLLQTARIHTAHIQRVAKGETQPWLAIWPTGIYIPPEAWNAWKMSGLFVRHDSAALIKAHAPRSKPERASAKAAT